MRCCSSIILVSVTFLAMACSGYALDIEIDIVGKTPPDIREQIYAQLYSKPCIRHLGRDGYIGCSGALRGDSGALRLLENLYDVDDFIIHAPLRREIVVLSSPLLLTQDIVSRLIMTESVSGIVVLFNIANDSVAGAELSHSERIPNRMSLLNSSSNYEWNPYGDALSLAPNDIPILLVSDVTGEEVEFIRSLSRIPTQAGASLLDFTDQSLYSATIHNFMHGGDDIETCIRRQTCIPVGGYSIWSYFGPFRGSLDGKHASYVLVSSPLDAKSYFYDKCPAAESAMSSLTALLFAAKALSSYDGIAQTKKQILFSLFSGEAFDFIGSRRFADDINNFHCEEYSDSGGCSIPWIPSLNVANITMEQIESLIDVGMLGIKPSSGDIAYLHTEHDGTGDTILNRLFNLSVVPEVDILSLERASVNTSGLPPGASHAFIRAASEANQTLPKRPAVAIADHHAAFATQRYQSSFDEYEVIDGAEVGEVSVSYICRAARTLAYAILAEAEELTSPINGTKYNLEVDCTELKVFYECITFNYSCDLLKERMRNPGPGDINHCSGVHIMKRIHNFARFMEEMLNEATTPRSYAVPCNTSADCNFTGVSDLMSFGCSLGKCVSLSTHLHPALPSDFRVGVDIFYGVYTWEIVEGHSTLPIWAESNWGTDLGIEVYRKATTTGEFLLIIFGLCLAVFFFAAFSIVGYQKRKYE